MIDLCLWVWMALANRNGQNRARIAGTVFFGFATLSIVGSIYLYVSVTTGVDGYGDTIQPTGASSLSIVLAVLSWLLGLFATVMMWNKSARPFYHPATQFAPVGAPMGWPQPGAPQFGVPQPGVAQPGMPPQGYGNPYQYPPVPGRPVRQPGQPTDSWQTPQG